MNQKKSKQSGFGLVETLLAIGAMSALSLGIYMALKPASATAQVKQEQTNLRDLASAVDRSWGLLGSFEGVSAERVRSDGLAPQRMQDGSALRTAWGTSISINPYAVNAPNDGFSVVYPLAPSEVCVRLASAVSRDTFDIRVDGVSLFASGELDPNAAVTECGRRDVATMEFIYHSGLVAGTAVAAPTPLVMPVAPPSLSAPGTAPVGAPVADVADVGAAIPLAPLALAPSVAPVAPAMASPSPVIPVVPTTPSPSASLPSFSGPTQTVAACVVPSNTVQNQDVNCAANQYGVIKQSRYATWSCPEAWDAPVRSPFSAWSTTSNSCTACPGASTETAKQWVATPSTCAAGQYGNRSWEREQSHSRSVNYNCPAGTRTLPAPTYGSWSAWKDTGAKRNDVNTCKSCPAASTETAKQWVNASGACPAGQTGTRTWQKEQSRTRSVSYNCPAGTKTLPAATYGSWSAWKDTGATRNTVSTCVSAKTCAVVIDSYGGTLDTSDAYWSISYTVNGVSGGCYVSIRDARDASSCREGVNGVLSLSQWQAVARDGDYYSTDGDTSGWEQSRGEYWGWYYTRWERRSGSACP